jgi:hypothetical protein
MLEHLNYFRGKACTIMTVQVNFPFKYEQMIEYFMGIVEDVVPQGVIISHIHTKCKSFIAMPYIVSITEEQTLYENNPEDAKIIEQYRKEKPAVAAKTAIRDSNLVNPAALTEIVKKGKEAFKT